MPTHKMGKGKIRFNNQINYVVLIILVYRNYDIIKKLNVLNCELIGDLMGLKS